MKEFLIDISSPQDTIVSNAPEFKRKTLKCHSEGGVGTELPFATVDSVASVP